jgi:hypothetical protein
LSFAPRSAARLTVARALLLIAAAPALAQGSSKSTWFEDVSEQAGIGFGHRRAATQRMWLPEIMSGGACWLDVDGDARLDLYLVQGGGLDEGDAKLPNELYRNLGNGRFEEIGEAAGADDRHYGMGCAVGDYDGDGDDDLYVSNVGRDTLYRNDSSREAGTVSFADVTAEAGLGNGGWGTSAAFVDYDADGDLDLFVVRYIHWEPHNEIECFTGANELDYCAPGNYNAPAPDLLYRNEGEGRFQEVSREAGLTRAFGNGLGIALGDFDDDGSIDIYVANDGDPNQLWRRRGGSELLVDDALILGVAVNRYGMAEAGRGTQVFDLEADGDVDLLATHLRDETNTLYVNQGEYFEDDTIAAALSAPSFGLTGFGIGEADFDLDGRGDLYIANGRVDSTLPALVEGDDYAEPDLLFRGLGDGRFEAVPTFGDATPPIRNGRAVAAADYDDDGDVDLLVLNNGDRPQLLRNLAPADAGRLVLRVHDRDGRLATGALVRIEIDGLQQSRVVGRSGSYLASHDPRVHFGLGPARSVDRVTVRWLGGADEAFGPFETGQTADIRQGTGQPLE